MSIFHINYGVITIHAAIGMCTIMMKAGMQIVGLCTTSRAICCITIGMLYYTINCFLRLKISSTILLLCQYTAFAKDLFYIQARHTCKFSNPFKSTVPVFTTLVSKFCSFMTFTICASSTKRTGSPIQVFPILFV